MLAIVQFDCAATPLVEEMLGDGRLPNLARLRDRGQWTPLDSPAEHFPAGTYHTLYSGVELGQHGQHYAFQWRPEEQRLDYRTSFPSPLAVWERAAAAGLRSVVIDPYESQPPRHGSGTVLSGWQFENVISLERWSSPRPAERELARLFGRAPLIQEVFGRPTARYLLAMRRTLLGGPARVGAAAAHLIARDRPDLVWATMLSAHLAGHMFWDVARLRDCFDGETYRVLEGTLRDVYEACDAAIGQIMRALPDGADLMLLSPMGMGPETSRVDILPAMLGAVTSGRAAEPGGSRLLWHARSAVPVEARAAVARLTGRRLTQQLTCRLGTVRTDWSRTTAFMLPSDHHGQIRLNIRGREREGIVDPASADALADEIADGLLSFRESDGERTVGEVWRTKDLIPATPKREMLPDLVVRFARTPMARDGVSRSPRYGEVHRDGHGTGRTGGHTPDAWALVVPGSAVAREAARPAVVDIPATVCELLGLPFDGVAGEPLLERSRAAAPAAA